MVKLFVYLLLLGGFLFFLSSQSKRQGVAGRPGEATPPQRKMRPKKNPRELWMQVYETKSVDEARAFQARLQEEEIDCIVYQQGKKDINGQPLRGIGVAVPKTAGPRAQGIISRMAV